MRHSFRFPWLADQLGGLTIRETVLRTWRSVNSEAIMTRAAAITFYGMAALVPFMGLVIALLAHGLPWLRRAASGDLQIDPMTDPLDWLMPVQAGSLIERELNRLRAEPPAGLLSFGLAALIWLSSSVFVEIIDAMHAIRCKRDTRPFWIRRLIAIVMTLGNGSDPDFRHAHDRELAPDPGMARLEPGSLHRGNARAHGRRRGSRSHDPASCSP